jgi:hypothetical protein
MGPKAKFEVKEHEVKECTKIDLFVENDYEINLLLKPCLK